MRRIDWFLEFLRNSQDRKFLFIFTFLSLAKLKEPSKQSWNSSSHSIAVSFDDKPLTFLISQFASRVTVEWNLPIKNSSTRSIALIECRGSEKGAMESVEHFFWNYSTVHLQLIISRDFHHWSGSHAIDKVNESKVHSCVIIDSDDETIRWLLDKMNFFLLRFRFSFFLNFDCNSIHILWTNLP